jgi:3-deoxy-manno-octulosonate cytidylyltransferase (CMP-KDO synthetase)
MKTALGVIPARWASSRLPGKPLADLCGKPMVQWVWERAVQSKSLTKVIVATDDARIADAVKKFGGDAVLTPDVPSGTDRAAWVAGDHDEDIVINIQGDEPLIHSGDIDRVVSLVAEGPAPVGTLIRRITSESDWIDPNVVKAVVDERGFALYFSRSPIPFSRDGEMSIRYKHIGLYGYTKSFLLDYVNWEPTPLERAEKLEQLRILEKGFRIRAAETEWEPVRVDTPADLESARREISKLIELELEGERSV